MTTRRSIGPLLLALAAMATPGCTKPTTVATPGDAGTQAAVKRKAPRYAPTAIEPAAGAPGLDSKVTKVTVYSDRARLTRSATVEATSQPTVYAFRELPGWVDDGSVRVSASVGRILDVRVERSFLSTPTDESWLKAEAEHKLLTQRLAALADELVVLDAQKKQIEAIKAFSLEKITKDTTIGDVKVETYADVLRFISDSLRRTAKARRKVLADRAEVEPAFQASLRALEEGKSLMKLEETTILVTLAAPSPARATIELTYMMPGATWQPMHELRVDTASSRKVEVLSFAVVTQTSGEDWGDAELSFSTQSSVAPLRIPELEQLTLGDTHTATRILTSKMSSFQRAQKAFEGQSALWNKNQKSRHERVRFDQVYEGNFKMLQTVQSKTVRIFESLQKRGTTAHFKAVAAPSVRGDGHPVRMRIGDSTLSSEQKIIAAPEQSLNAARTLSMVNSSGQALLPGRVALYQDRVFLGMTDVDFIAQGESFSLFLSVADHLKLSRKLDKKRSALIRRRRNRMQISFIVTVENLSNKPTRMTLADRIPVSENREIRVDRVKITPNAQPDSRGLLHWDLALRPKEKRQFRISYQVEYPSALILETRRRQKMERSRGSSSPARRQKYRIEEQLLDLESQF